MSMCDFSMKDLEGSNEVERKVGFSVEKKDSDSCKRELDLNFCSKKSTNFFKNQSNRCYAVEVECFIFENIVRFEQTLWVGGHFLHFNNLWNDIWGRFHVGPDIFFG